MYPKVVEPVFYRMHAVLRFPRLGTVLSSGLTLCFDVQLPWREFAPDFVQHPLSSNQFVLCPSSAPV